MNWPIGSAWLRDPGIHEGDLEIHEGDLGIHELLRALRAGRGILDESQAEAMGQT